MLKLDLHLHSCYSDDAIGTPEEYVKSLKKKGLQGMALTDHNTVQGNRQTINSASKEFLVIPSMEISTKDGHLLALNITEVIPRGLSVVETVEKIREIGGIPIVPHLYRMLSGIKKDSLKNIRSKLSAIEVFNGCSLPSTNLKTAKIAHTYHLGGTGGSDSHDPVYAGYAYTVVNTTDITLDTVLSEIEKGKTWGEGVTMPLSYRRDRMVLSVRQYLQRGFRRI